MADKPQLLVSAIVSTYASEQFIEGCLANLVNQSIFDRMEVIVVDANSPENEGEIVRKFQKQYPNIKYIRTSERIGIYHAWNVGIRNANGKYLTNANTDDRRHPQCTEKLVQALENNPDAGLAYSDIAITNELNKPFGEARIVGSYNWLDYDHINLMRRCEVGPMPVWRASLHSEIGLFDERYYGAGDYEFWLRISEKYRLVHVKEVLGQYLQYDNNLETRNMQRKFNEEHFTKFSAIERFLNRPMQQRESEMLLATHLSAVQTYLQQGQALPPDELNKFEFHYYACALLLAYQGKRAEAIAMLEDWLQSINSSKNIGHLLYGLLQSSPETRLKPDAAVSIIVVDNAHPDLLRRTLESVLQLQYDNWDITIVTARDTDKEGDYLDQLSAATMRSQFAERLRELPSQRFRVVKVREVQPLPKREDSAAQSGDISAVEDAVQQTTGQYICLLKAGEVLNPEYIADASSILDSQQDAGWVSGKTLLFSSFAQSVWGAPFSLRQMLTSPPAAGHSLFRRSAWDSLKSRKLIEDDFEHWNLWLSLAECGWKHAVVDGYSGIRNIIHGEDLNASQTKARQMIRLTHPWWFRKERAGGGINEEAVLRYENLSGQKEWANEVKRIAAEGACGSAHTMPDPASKDGRIRLAQHYLQKGNVDKAKQILSDTLADDPDNEEALRLRNEL